MQIVRWFHISEDLSKGVLTIDRGDTPIHDGSWPRVSILIRELCICWVETCMVPFSADNDRNLRSIRLLSISEAFESFDHPRVFFIDDDTELPFGDTIAVDDDSAR